MAKSKVWKIRGTSLVLSDEELISLIKLGKISKDALLATSDMKVWIALKDSIYQFYLEEKQNETI